MNFDLLNELMEQGMSEDFEEVLYDSSVWELIDLIKQLHLMCTDLDRFDELVSNTPEP